MVINCWRFCLIKPCVVFICPWVCTRYSGLAPGKRGKQNGEMGWVGGDASWYGVHRRMTRPQDVLFWTGDRSRRTSCLRRHPQHTAHCHTALCTQPHAYPLSAASQQLFSLFLFSFALISPFIFFPLHNTIIVSPMQGIFHCIFIGNSAFTFNFLYYKICSCNHLLVSSRCY